MSDINEKLRSDQLIMTSQLKSTHDSGIGEDGGESLGDLGIDSRDNSQHEASLQDELFGMNYSIGSTHEGKFKLAGRDTLSSKKYCILRNLRHNRFFYPLHLSPLKRVFHLQLILDHWKSHN